MLLAAPAHSQSRDEVSRLNATKEHVGRNLEDDVWNVEDCNS